MVSFHHVQLAIPEGGEEAGRAFYGVILGFDEIPKPASLASRGGCWFRSPGGAEIHLGVETPFAPARKAHPALVVTDIDALAGRLVNSGHPVSWDDEYPGHRRFYVSDPFQNRLEIMATESSEG